MRGNAMFTVHCLRFAHSLSLTMWLPAGLRGFETGYKILRARTSPGPKGLTPSRFSATVFPVTVMQSP